MFLRLTKKLGFLPMFVAGLLCGAAMTGTAFAYQGHMWNALHALENAKNQLEVATPDKGGHREDAIDLVNQAIGQVNMGIQVGAK